MLHAVAVELMRLAKEQNTACKLVYIYTCWQDEMDIVFTGKFEDLTYLLAKARQRWTDMVYHERHHPEDSEADDIRYMHICVDIDCPDADMDGNYVDLGKLFSLRGFY